MINFSKIECTVDKNKEMPEGMSINSTPTIKGIKKEESEILGLKDLLSIGFSFAVEYGDGVGKLYYEGNVLYQSKKASSILEKWETGKILEESAAVDVLNALFRKCLTLSLALSTELRLPAPMRFPNVVVDKKKDKQAS